MKKISGVDGCRGGWLAFHFDGKYWSENLFRNINELYSESDSELILIDIPIGLRETESPERLCDLESRKILNKRKSSIFPAPSRLAIHCDRYREASQKNEETTGRKLSQQSFGIIPKIREVDVFIQSKEYVPKRKRIRETHPEICFWGLNGCSEMKYNKKYTLGKMPKNGKALDNASASRGLIWLKRRFLIPAIDQNFWNRQNPVICTCYMQLRRITYTGKICQV